MWASACACPSGLRRYLLVLLALTASIALMLPGCSLSGSSRDFHGIVVDHADFGRNFALHDFHGQERHLADYRGKVVVLFFGYTQCPDVCPSTLATLAETMRLLDAEAKHVQVLFITLDPERDTPALLAAYVPQFNANFVGLSGSPSVIADTAREFRVVYQKNTDRITGSYSLDHSTYTYIYDPQGRLRLIEKYGETAEHLAEDIRRIQSTQSSRSSQSIH